MGNKLLRYLDVQAEEQRNFTILFLQTLLLGFATSFFFVSATSHFVKTAGVQNLPFAYLISGVVGFALVSLYRKMQTRRGLITSYSAGLVLYAILCMVLYLLYTTGQPSQTTARVLAYTGLVLIMPFTAIFTIGFSMTSLQVFSFAQSKRLLAMVGTGETVAAIVAFVSVPFLMKLIGDSVHLLPASAVLVLTALVPLRKLVQHNREKFVHIVTKRNSQTGFSLSFLRKDTFFRAIMLFTFFSVLAIYLADYGYLLAVRFFSVQTDIETASIVAVIFSVIKTGELLFSFLSRSIQSRYGMRVSLLLLPCLLILFSAFAIGSSLLDTDPLFLLFFLIINKFNERVIRKGITTPSMKVVYQVTEPAERARLQTNIEGVFSQVATIAAGGLLMLISLAHSGSPAGTLRLLNIVTIVCLVVYIGWLLVSMEVFARYKEKINHFLFRHKPSQLLEQASSKPMEQWLAVVKRTGALPSDPEINTIDFADREQVFSVILHYNPSLKDFTGEQQTAPDMFLKRLIRSYFNNDNFFSRVAIIRYAHVLSPLQKLRLFREVYQISNQLQRLFLARMLNEETIGGVQQDSFYFTTLVQESAREAIQLEAAINDLLVLEDRSLHDQLKKLLKRQKNVLLELLKLIYDRNAISVIQSVIDQPDPSEEHQHFAVELLGSIVKPGIKEYVIPVFEPVAFHTKRNKLSALFFIYELPAQERLKDVAMTNVKLVDPYVKELAIRSYEALTGDSAWLRAFAGSNWLNLRRISLSAEEVGRGGENEGKLADSLRSSSLDPYCVTAYEQSGKLSESPVGGGKDKIDAVSLAMLFAVDSGLQ